MNMDLQRATTLALYGMALLLVVSLANWVLFSFNLISYFNNVRFYRILQLSIIFLQSLPLILFLYVLKKNQKRGNGDK